MSNFNPNSYNSSNNVFNNHPLITNANQYFFEKKFVSIHSEDRDLTKYPNSSEFEIELPQDYLNVVSVHLYSWSFPSNYSVFNKINSNVTLIYKFTKLYNPGEYNNPDILANAIFAALYPQLNKELAIVIEPGFYNPPQMSNELTNKLNQCVTNIINNFLNDPENTQYSDAKQIFQSYNRFTIVYNSVQLNLWFGNSADQFELVNSSVSFDISKFSDASCRKRSRLPDSSNWGLPAYLGFNRCNIEAKTVSGTDSALVQDFNQIPRFYYGDVTTVGDKGYWIYPSEPDSQVYFISAPFKINFMGPAYIYMEIDGLNCIDETSPYNLSPFTIKTNETNGIVNSSFAKLAIPTTPISQWFDVDSRPYKYFNPPAERIRKLKIKFRFHNNQLVDFGSFDYSFMLEFNLFTPQQERKWTARDAFSLSSLG
jgi:hypothetical protein